MYKKYDCWFGEFFEISDAGDDDDELIVYVGHSTTGTELTIDTVKLLIKDLQEWVRGKDVIK